MWRQVWRLAAWPIERLVARGSGCFCPVCERPSRRFLPFGAPARPSARCVYCGALERHRLLWLYLRDKTDLLTAGAKRTLHIAPEPCLERRLRPVLAEQYVTADLSDRRADRRLDVTDMPFPDGSFDLLLCSHVLEHVRDDRRALAEFHRVLRPGGCALILIPIEGEVTQEAPALCGPSQQRQLFGQADHVRRCGRDYLGRIQQAGFQVRVVGSEQLVPNPQCRRQLGLSLAADELWVCTR